MIKAQVIGHLGKDAQVNTVNGKSVINFSIAHTENFTDHQGNKKSNTIWAACSYWVERTTIVNYLKQGTMVYVEGQPSVKTYQGQRGTEAQLVLRVSSIQLLGSKNSPQNSQQENSSGVSGYSTGELVEPLDEVPF